MIVMTGRRIQFESWFLRTGEGEKDDSPMSSRALIGAAYISSKKVLGSISMNPIYAEPPP